MWHNIFKNFLVCIFNALFWEESVRGENFIIGFINPAVIRQVESLLHGIT